MLTMTNDRGDRVIYLRNKFDPFFVSPLRASLFSDVKQEIPPNPHGKMNNASLEPGQPK